MIIVKDANNKQPYKVKEESSLIYNSSRLLFHEITWTSIYFEIVRFLLCS